MTPQKAYLKSIKENKRMLDLEDIISIDPEHSYLYAYNIIKESWEKGEKSYDKTRSIR